MAAPNIVSVATITGVTTAIAGVSTEGALESGKYVGVTTVVINAASSGKVRISRDKFQNPNWKRHNILAYNYRLPEICAAVALSQVEKIDMLCELRCRMGLKYLQTVKSSKFDILITQQKPKGYTNSYYTFAALFNGEKYGVTWQEFRKVYMEFGGDGIYAAWQLVPNEPAFKNQKIGWGKTPVAEKLQRNLMQFTCNQANADEITAQAECLRKTLNYYGL